MGNAFHQQTWEKYVLPAAELEGRIHPGSGEPLKSVQDDEECRWETDSEQDEKAWPYNDGDCGKKTERACASFEALVREKLAGVKHDIWLSAESGRDGVERRFAVHSRVLSTCKYFSELIVQHEPHGNIPTLPLSSYSSEDVEVILRHMYGLPFSRVPTDVAWEVREFALTCGLEKLKEEMEDFLVTGLTSSTFCEVLSQCTADPCLLHKCVARLPEIRHHRKILKSPAFSAMRLDPQLCVLLQCPDLDVDYKMLWHHCQLWLRVNTSEKHRLSAQIRLQTLVQSRQQCLELRFLRHDIPPIIEEVEEK